MCLNTLVENKSKVNTHIVLKYTAMKVPYQSSIVTLSCRWIYVSVLTSSYALPLYFLTIIYVTLSCPLVLMPAGQFYFLPNSLQPHPEIMGGTTEH